MVRRRRRRARPAKVRIDRPLQRWLGLSESDPGHPGLEQALADLRRADGGDAEADELYRRAVRGFDGFLAQARGGEDAGGQLGRLLATVTVHRARALLACAVSTSAPATRDELHAQVSGALEGIEDDAALDDALRTQAVGYRLRARAACGRAAEARRDLRWLEDAGEDRLADWLRVARAGDDAFSVETLEAALARFGGRSDVRRAAVFEVTRELARSHLRQGAFARALSHYSVLMSIDSPDNPWRLDPVVIREVGEAEAGVERRGGGGDVG